MDYKVHNKTDIPDNIIENQNKIIDKAIEIQHALPFFMRDFFIYLKSSVAISSRQAYLTDILFFCEYLVNETDLTDVKETKKIKIDTFNNMKARDINYFLGEYCTRYFVETKTSKYIMKNNNRTLSRKRSSLTVLIKFLYRNEQIENNISENGEGLSEKQKQYWKKTKHRDKAIIMLFVTYGLRLSELQQLNVDSFSFKRGTFKIYRKRDKIVDMPINKSVEKSIKTYLNMERNMNTTEIALFLSLQNQRMSTRAIRKLIKKYTAIGMETSYENGYSPHKLRATAATSLLEHGFSIYDVKSLLDHDNVTTTQLYASHRKNAKRNIIKNFELDDEY